MQLLASSKEKDKSVREKDQELQEISYDNEVPRGPYNTQSEVVGWVGSLKICQGWVKIDMLTVF